MCQHTNVKSSKILQILLNAYCLANNEGQIVCFAQNSDSYKMFFLNLKLKKIKNKANNQTIIILFLIVKHLFYNNLDI